MSIESLFSKTIVKSLLKWKDDFRGPFRVCAGGVCKEILEDEAEKLELIHTTSECFDSDITANCVRADMNQLPYLSGSINLLVMPLTLEMCAAPERVMREAERVLADNGRLVLFGINPWSHWSLLRRISGGSDDLARRQQRISRRRVKEWLLLLGFDIERQTSLLYSLPHEPFESAPEERRIDKIGRQLLPGCGILYGLQAIKRVTPLMPTKAPLRQINIANAEATGYLQTQMKSAQKEL